MKYLLLLLLPLLSFSASANSLILDPTIEGQKNVTVTCTANLEREDGTPMVIGEIAYFSYYISTDGTAPVNADADTPTCRQVFNLEAVPDGVHIYQVTETDTEGRESALSATQATVTVKRLANPGDPGGVTAVAF